MPLKRTALTIISGYLGSGKTTLVNRLLAVEPDIRFGIVVNEFGEQGIDADLIETEEEAIVEINNGCICCTVRTDIVTSITRLLARSCPPVQRLIIETSGLADPAPVIQSFLVDATLRSQVAIESVVAVVDAQHFQADGADEILREQIAFADLVVLNKITHPSTDEAAIRTQIRHLNPTAEITLTSCPAITSAQILGTPRFQLPNLLAIEPNLLEAGPHDHEHDTSITSVSAQTSGSLDPMAFNAWVNKLVQEQGTTLLRMKGILNFQNEPRQFVFHSVHMVLEALPGRAWAEGEPRCSKIVFIGRNLDPSRLNQGFQACVSPTSRSIGEGA